MIALIKFSAHNARLFVSQVDAGWEEYFDYIFPEEEETQPNLKLLAMAKMWKAKREGADTDSSSSSDDDDDENEDEDEDGGQSHFDDTPGTSLSFS